MKLENGITGILLGAGGVAMLCVMDATAKALGASFNTFQVGFVRYFSAALWLVPFMLLTGRGWPSRKNMPRHLVRGALVALTAVFFFYGIVHLPLAVATALAMSAPVYISLFGIFLLKEPFSPTLLWAVAFGRDRFADYRFCGRCGSPEVPMCSLGVRPFWRRSAMQRPLSYSNTTRPAMAQRR